MRKWIASAALLAVLPVNAAEPYAGIGLTQADYMEDGFPTVTPTALTLKLGTQINPNFAVEGRLGIGVADDSMDIFGFIVDVEVDNYYGLYFKGILPTEVVSPYLLIGFTKGKLTASAGGFSVSESDSSESYGLGIDVALSKTAALNFEFAKLLDGDGYEVETMSAGVAFRF